jgi:hypothetical protein
MTAEIIAMKKSTHTTTYQPRWRPGKSGLRRGSTNAEMSAKATNARPTEASPILLAVDNAATTNATVESIGAGTYRN